MTWISFVKRMLALPVLALAGAYSIMAIWHQLIRYEIIENTTFMWFPTVAIVWGCFCLVACTLLGWPEKQSNEQETSSEDN